MERNWFIYEGNPMKKMLDDGEYAYLPSFFIVRDCDGKRFQSCRFESREEANEFLLSDRCNKKDYWIEV